LPRGLVEGRGGRCCWVVRAEVFRPSRRGFHTTGWPGTVGTGKLLSAKSVRGSAADDSDGDAVVVEDGLGDAADALKCCVVKVSHRTCCVLV
jgi:hypothetical protein